MIRMPLVAQRAATYGMFRQLPTSRLVRATSFVPTEPPALNGYWVRRDVTARGPAILYLHGGGYGFGSVEMYSEVIARLADLAGADVLAIDYRLAPEFPFPAQLEDTLLAYNHMLEQGIAPERIVIAGDSAGGGLTLSTLLRLRNSGAPLPAAGVLLSPWVDLRNQGESIRDNDRFDYIGKAALDQYAARFVSGRDLDNAYASPINADLAGLPPLLVQVGSAETLLSDSRLLADRVAMAGGQVELQVYDDMIHVFQLFGHILEAGRAACRAAAEFTRKHTGAASS